MNTSRPHKSNEHLVIDRRGHAERQNLILVAASKSRQSDKWADDDYDVWDGKAKVVGRIVRADGAPPGRPWFWTITERALQRPTDLGYAATRDDAMAAFKSARSSQDRPVS